MGRKALLVFYAAGAGAAILSIVKGTASFISLIVCIGYLLCGLAIIRKGGEKVRKAALGFGYLLGFMGVILFSMPMLLLIAGSKIDVFSLGVGVYLIIISVFTIKYLKHPYYLVKKSEMEPT